MSIINKDKAAYAIQTFIMFLTIAKEGQSSDILSFKEQAIDLLTQLTSNQLDSESATMQLNTLIEKLNQFVKAPYPALMIDTTENLVKTEIVAFEHYLNLELKVNHLTIQQEAPLFNDSLRLWESIGVSLSAKEGISQFAALIEKVNGFLPENERYPLPDINQY